MRTIVLITNVYPTGSVTEGSFIEPELEALRRNFDRVIVVPVFDSGERQHIPCPEVEADLSLAQPLSLLSRISRLRFLASPSVLRELPRIIRSVRGFRRCAGQCFYYMNVSYMHRKLLRWMKRRQIDPAQTLFYTFWFDFPTVALARISAECGATVVSRAHGYDVYDNAHPNRPPELRRFALEHLSALYVVSEAGAAALNGFYPGFEDRIKVRHLGSSKPEPDSLSRPNDPDSGCLTFLSVARAVPGKGIMRNLAFAAAVARRYPDRTIRWIHVGDGPEMTNLRSQCDRERTALPNLTVDLRGALPNSGVHDLYRSEKIDWLLLFSDSEGLPIAICEGLSYGVPVIATAVGGVPEIVTPEAGVTVAPDAAPDEIADRVAGYFCDPDSYLALRRSAFELWKRSFSSDALRVHFAAEIAGLQKKL